MARQQMPTIAQFAAAEKVLVSRGYKHRSTIMADDARKEGVTNFGKFFSKDTGEQFYLNYKTIGNLPE